MMSINLLEKIQKNLAYPVLQKIDPNTQQVTVNEKTPDEDKFSQAAIPAVLTGLYKYVQSDTGAEEFLRGENSPDWVGKIFESNKKEVIQTISSYSKEADKNPVPRMNAIANEAVKVVKEALPANASGKDVKLFFKDQKNNILHFLPAVLNMGDFLNDTTLDDKTNKMEGPISSLIQNIGSAFSSPVPDEKVKTNNT